MSITLRPDQQQLKNEIYQGWQSGARNMLAQLPTGGGKSVILTDVIKDVAGMQQRQIVMAHRKELVSQMSVHVARRGIQHRIIGPANVIRQVTEEHRKEFNGRSFINPSAFCSVGSVDTILSRSEQLEQWALQQSYWYLDEAHHALVKNKWGKCIALFQNANGLGVTATPERADGQGIGSHADGVFDAMVCGPTMRELIKLGALSDYEIAVPESDFIIDEATAPSGDFSLQKMREASKKSHITGDVVKEYVRRALGKRAIVFATDVETSNQISKNFNEAGISAASVSAKTPDEVRLDYIRRFRDGRITVLVNVDLFGEGFDVPAVEVVVMARPTASLAVYLQQFGRVLRVMEGKQFGLVIDHVSNYKRHGLPDKPRLWTMDRREKRAKKEPDPEDIPMTACIKCSKPYERIFPACPHCGFMPDLTPQQRSAPEMIDGDLILLDRNILEQMRKEAELETPVNIALRVTKAAGEIAGKSAANKQMERWQSQSTLKESIAIWAGNQRAMGRKDQESYRRFYLATGVDVLTAISQPREKMDKLNEIIKGWI